MLQDCSYSGTTWHHFSQLLNDALYLLQLLDVETQAVIPPNQPGIICLKGPMIMKGYRCNPKETQEIIDKDGWLITGDIGYFDEDGCLYIVDRVKELIKYKAYQVRFYFLFLRSEQCFMGICAASTILLTIVIWKLACISAIISDFLYPNCPKGMAVFSSSFSPEDVRRRRILL